jgi:hypothetical protein
MACKVGGQRGTVLRFDPPEHPSGGISASPFLTSPFRTRRAAFTATGSPVAVPIPLSIEQDLRITRPSPSRVRVLVPVSLRPVSGITLSIWLLWQLRCHEGLPF